MSFQAVVVGPGDSLVLELAVTSGSLEPSAVSTGSLRVAVVGSGSLWVAEVSTGSVVGLMLRRLPSKKSRRRLFRGISRSSAEEPEY